MKRPKIIMLRGFGQESLTRQATALGVDCFLPKRIDMDTLGKRIRFLIQKLPADAIASFSSSSSPIVKTAGSRRNLLGEVTQVIHEIGIPAHVKGCQYIIEAILMVVDEGSLLGAEAKDLYSDIPKKYNTAGSRIERGIRHAIELAWERLHTETLKQIFEHSMDIDREIPTNLEFIAILADKFRVMDIVG